jgi:methylated-DNA-[protein]-cysteine S-methyltransferase
MSQAHGIRYLAFETPLGPMFAVAADGKITRLDFVDAKYAPEIGTGWEEAPTDPVLARCAGQLREYFAGDRRSFDFPTKPAGTDFQKSVWREIARVPFGETITYGELARRASTTASARAAGTATGKNPIAVAVPCHRIVGANRSLTGYAGGIPRKTRLLELEGVLLKVTRSASAP